MKKVTYGALKNAITEKEKALKMLEIAKEQEAEKLRNGYKLKRINEKTIALIKPRKRHGSKN